MKIPKNQRKALEEHMGSCFMDALSVPRQEHIVRLEIEADKKDARIEELEAAARCAIAALSQNATLITLAVNTLKRAIGDEEDSQQ